MPSRPPATCRRSCSTRPAPSRSATAAPCELIPVGGADPAELGRAAYLGSLADETPEGRSVVELAARGLDAAETRTPLQLTQAGATFVEFTAQTRMSGVDLDGTMVRKGAGSQVVAWTQSQGGSAPDDLEGVVDGIARSGGTPLVVARSRERRGRPGCSA